MSEKSSSVPASELCLGTAGHIDHGKTELIRALTGVETDRLPEEKRRGITIELGFAPLDLGDGRRLSVIDVPGHEGLVRTMVAGASGIDLVLLVVAADEGVMPQTREHLAICELLGLERGVVALSKTDLVDPEMAELAAAEVEELLAGSSLRGAPVVPVSARREEGLDALREALRKTADLADLADFAGPANRGDATDPANPAAARTSRTGPPRLWVDRVFSARGFGSVATGTLIGSSLAVGETVELLPSGATARVRGIERFGGSLDRATPGARTALNLQGVDVAELPRGELVTRPGALSPTRVFDAELHWLPDAPASRDLASVELLVGTAERRGRIGAIGPVRGGGMDGGGGVGEVALSPGGRGFARIHVDGAPLALLPGDRFVVRGFGQTRTLGGGRVLDVAPPRRRRSDPGLSADLAVLAEGGEAALELRVRRAGLAGLHRDALLRQTGAGPGTLAGLVGAGARVRETLGGDLLSADVIDEIAARIEEALSGYHVREPLRPGMPRAALAGTLPGNTAPGAFELALTGLDDAGALTIRGDHVALADFAPRLSPEQEARAAHLRASAMAAGLEPATPAEWAAELGCPAAVLGDLLAFLEREGSLVRVGELWFDRVAVDELRERVLAHLTEHTRLDTPGYKALIDAPRKFAIPLMEHFDALHLTARQGDARILHPRLKKR